MTTDRSFALSLDHIDVLTDWVLESLDERLPIVTGGPLDEPHPLVGMLMMTLLSIKAISTQNIGTIGGKLNPRESAWWLRCGRFLTPERQTIGWQRIRDGWGDVAWVHKLTDNARGPAWVGPKLRPFYRYETLLGKSGGPQRRAASMLEDVRLRLF